MSAIAPKGQLTMHIPQETHLSALILARPRSSVSIALTPHASAQGRVRCAMASYGQAALHLPHLMHLDWSMTDRPFTMDTAPFGQTVVQGCATQPRQLSVTLYMFGSQAAQAEGMTCISGGS